MNPLLIVGLVAVVLLGLCVRFFRGTFSNLSAIVAVHAKVYALVYVKGAALISIAMLSNFDETFRNLTKDAASGMPWWGFMCLFFKPILAGLSVLVAFLDTTLQRVNQKREANDVAVASGEAPPFPSVQPSVPITPITPTAL